MAAALTIVVLFALSFAVVRVAAVAMRLTGLPETAARFQCISALTGTGFTTSESEMIVNYPIRRRILVVLMIVGNLGLASVAATFMVSMIGTEAQAGAMAAQLLMIAIAVAFTVLFMTNKALDRAMCGFIGLVLRRVTSLGKRRYNRVLQLADGFSIAEHEVSQDTRLFAELASFAELELKLLAIRTSKTREYRSIGECCNISPGDILVCYASDAAHDAFEDRMADPCLTEHTTAEVRTDDN